MGYDGGYYMMGGMHGLWWLFWVVLLGVLVFSGARAGDWRNRSGQTLRDTLTSCCNVAWRGANSLPLNMKSVSRCLIGIHGPIVAKLSPINIDSRLLLAATAKTDGLSTQTQRADQRAATGQIEMAITRRNSPLSKEQI